MAWITVHRQWGSGASETSRRWGCFGCRRDHIRDDGTCSKNTGARDRNTSPAGRTQRCGSGVISRFGKTRSTVIKEDSGAAIWPAVAISSHFELFSSNPFQFKPKTSNWSVIGPPPHPSDPLGKYAYGPITAAPKPCRPRGSGGSVSHRSVFGS